MLCSLNGNQMGYERPYQWISVRLNSSSLAEVLWEQKIPSHPSYCTPNASFRRQILRLRLPCLHWIDSKTVKFEWLLWPVRVGWTGPYLYLAVWWLAVEVGYLGVCSVSQPWAPPPTLNTPAVSDRVATARPYQWYFRVVGFNQSSVHLLLSREISGFFKSHLMLFWGGQNPFFFFFGQNSKKPLS